MTSKISLSQQRSIARRQSDAFRKRKESIIRKASCLHERYDADVFLLLFRKGKYHILTSADNGSWPPTFEEARKYYPLPDIRKTTDTFASSAKAGQKEGEGKDKGDGDCTDEKSQADGSEKKAGPEADGSDEIEEAI